MQFDERYCEARLVARDDVADDLVVFRLQPADELMFQPGQYATIGLEGEAPRPLLRPYSVVSAPHESQLEVYVEKGPEGTFTPHLWPLTEGDVCWVRRRIVGRFLYQEDARNHLMLATVTGVGPYISMIRTRIHNMSQRDDQSFSPILLIHGASHPHEFGPYLDELAAYAEQFDWLSFVPTVSRPWDHPEWTGEKGRVEDVIRKFTDASAFLDHQTAVYACGHPGMIENAENIVRRAGFSDTTFMKEEYFRE